MVIGSYELLIEAIIKQTIIDREHAEKCLHRRPGNTMAQELKKETEGFILSDWFYELTGIEGKIILKKIKEEIK